MIILEEDLMIAPDFFEFFSAVAHYVDDDPSVLAASAWNDNGVKGYVRDEKALYRSDFFPGLGWMISRCCYCHFLCCCHNNPNLLMFSLIYNDFYFVLI